MESSDSKSNADDARTQTGAGTMADEENPFRIDGLDEMIFTFKEAEKDRKTLDREKNKRLKIWEKNKPVREGCLRKICETDIEPTQLAINPKVQGLVNAGEGANFNIPIERPKNRDSRWTLIQKKREMGLVRMMLETKQQEIERLAEEANMQEDGLRCSETMLEEDTQQFLAFFNQIKTETQRATEQLDMVRKEKTERLQTLKGIEERIHMIHSNASKHIEQLELYNEYKVFLDNLYKNKPGADSDDDGDSPQQKAKSPARRQMIRDDEMLDLQIPPSLAAIIEDAGRMSNPPFTEPAELIEIFTTMEEQNLEKIQMMQDSEQQLEMAKANFKKTSDLLDNKVDQLKENERKNEESIRVISQEKDALSLAFEEVGKSSLIDPTDLAEITKTTRELYVDCVRSG